MVNWTIERWAYPIQATGGLANHNFLVLKDGNGNIIKELTAGAAAEGGGVKTTALI
jgi:hypothetical protein